MSDSHRTCVFQDFGPFASIFRRMSESFGSDKLWLLDRRSFAFWYGDGDGGAISWHEMEMMARR
jgi:hypothetical protein